MSTRQTTTEVTPIPHEFTMTVRFAVDPRGPSFGVQVFTDGSRMGTYQSYYQAGDELAAEFAHRIKESLPGAVVELSPGPSDPCVRHEAWRFVGVDDADDVNLYRCSCGATGEYGG